MLPLGNNGVEWPTKPSALGDLEVELSGGLGSSCNSLILGGDTKVGEALGDTFGDIIGDTFGGDNNWVAGFRRRGPENNWGCSAETGLVDNGLLVIGPEKAYLLVFLESKAANGSSRENRCPSARGGGNRVDAVLLLLSLSTDCEFLVVGLLDISTPNNFSIFFWSRGDECHKLGVRLLKLIFSVPETGLPDPVGFELLGSAGVGKT